METGRNDPCPCGSGEKYKNCCLEKEGAQAEPLAFHRLRAIRPHLLDRLFQFVLDTYGWAAVFEAWDEFQGTDQHEYDEEDDDQDLFQPFLLFDWTPVKGDTHVPLSLPTDVPPAAVFLERQPEELDPLARKYVDAACDSPFGYHEITAVEEGQAVRLRDLLTGTERRALEKEASRVLQPGDLVLAKPVTVEGVTILEGLSPYPIAADRKEQIRGIGARLAKRRALMDTDLPQLYEEIFETYRKIRDEGMPDPEMRH